MEVHVEDQEDEKHEVVNDILEKINKKELRKKF